MKIGVKAGHWVSKKYIKKMSSDIDFFEIYATENWDQNNLGLENYRKPIAIHVPHFKTRVNFANPERIENNLKALRLSISLANRFDSQKIIFHPELAENKNCSIDYLIRFLKENYDSRLLVENMPYSSEGFKHFCGNLKEVKNLIERAKVGFCFDYTHVAEYAKKMNLDLGLLFKQFLSLGPKHFHLTDTDLSKVSEIGYNEEHLNFWDGNVDFNLIKSNIPDDAWITLETPQSSEKQIREVEWLKEYFAY